MGGRHWSEKEIKILQEKYLTASRKELLNLLPNRTWGSIRAKAKKIGLKYRKVDKEGKVNMKKARKRYFQENPYAAMKGAEKQYNLKINLEPSYELSYILGVLLGDGCIYKNKYKHIIKLEVKDKEFANTFKEALSNIGLNANIYTYFRKDKQGEFYIAYAYSRRFYEWYKGLTLEDIKKIVSDYKESFIKGFYESEGCFRFRGPKKNRPQIQIANTEKMFIKMIKELLETLHIKSKMYFHKSNRKNWKDAYFLFLNREEDIYKFAKKISPCIKRIPFKQNEISYL